MRVLAIPGSLRRDSFNARLLRHVAERAPAAVEVELYDGLGSIPPYDEDDDTASPPRPVADLRERIAAADALLIATPEYNSSIPGALKNAVDWASRPRAATVLRDLPAAVIGASTGRFGGVWAQAELRKVLASSGARVLGLELAVPLASSAFDPRGELLDPALTARAVEILEALAVAAAARLAVAA